MTNNPLDLIKRLTEALRIQADDFGTDAQLLKDANSFISRCCDTEISSQPITREWLPIDTAPKDGTVIFAACLEWHNSQLFWNNEYEAWEDYVDSGRFRTPVAWVPIPELSAEERKLLESTDY